jgi:hypothetical protein
MKPSRLLPALVTCAILAACAGNAGTAADTTTGAPHSQLPGPGTVGPGADGPPGDDTLLVRLEREAVALARADGCTAAGQCRTAPVGNRPCGGPRHYLAYCATATDSVALFRKLDELARAETEYNQRHGLMSTCEFRMPPELEVVGGVCRARQTP